MIVRTLQEAEQSARRIVSPDGNWESTRLLLKDDGMGFSFHITTIYKGAELPLHYQNHLEAVYCIEGQGEIEDKHTGQVHRISAGTIYALDKNDKHVLTAETTMRMICVFNPPLVGPESHDENGAYPLLD